MARHVLTHADRIFLGDSYEPGYESSQRGVEMTPTFWHNFGAPAAAVANGIAQSQSITPPAAGVLNGSLVSGGVAVLDVPRNVVAAWTGAAVLTITGRDVYGRVMVEQSPSGTTHTGTKAFKTVTSITVSAAVTLFTAGTGDVLGLPFRVSANGLIAARANNAIDAGTFVPAVTTTPTATTGDVRGTFDPAVALNGSNTVAVLIKPHSLADRDGAFGLVNFAG